MPRTNVGSNCSLNDKVFIILDKMDKIGIEGVQAELMEAGYSKEQTGKYLGLFQGMEDAQDPVSYIMDALKDVLPAGVQENLFPVNFPTILSYLPPPPQLPPNSGMATSKIVPV